MNVPECLICGVPGSLRLGEYPGPVVVHARGRRCELPPRDDRLPRITPPPVAPRWVDRYPSPYKEAS